MEYCGTECKIHINFSVLQKHYVHRGPQRSTFILGVLCGHFCEELL